MAEPVTNHRPESGATSFVLGIDSGGSGVRVALAPTGSAHAALRAASRGTGGPDGTGAAAAAGSLTFRSASPATVGERGIDADSLLGRVVPAVTELLERAGGRRPRLVAACVGAAGMATLGDDLRARLPVGLARAFGVRRLALAADGVTGYAGALGQRPGAVVAAGTGVIALGTGLVSDTDGESGWRRADGWGHLLGDCGGGAWIGQAGLTAALRAHDGREAGSAPLADRATRLLGPLSELPGRLYPRADRSAFLAAFAPEVGRAAELDGDPVAVRILTEAARNIAQSAEAVCPRASGRAVALTGGLLQMGEPLCAPLRAELSRRLPGVEQLAGGGDPLAGSLYIAAALARDALLLPRDAALLHVM